LDVLIEEKVLIKAVKCKSGVASSKWILVGEKGFYFYVKDKTKRWWAMFED